jgi:lipid-A-disaccharide synthase-like uncharacterized protein
MMLDRFTSQEEGIFGRDVPAMTQLVSLGKTRHSSRSVHESVTILEWFHSNVIRTHDSRSILFSGKRHFCRRFLFTWIVGEGRTHDSRKQSSWYFASFVEKIQSNHRYCCCLCHIRDKISSLRKLFQLLQHYQKLIGSDKTCLSWVEVCFHCPTCRYCQYRHWTKSSCARKLLQFFFTVPRA